MKNDRGFLKQTLFPLLLAGLAVLAAAPDLVAAGKDGSARPDIKWTSEIDWRTWEEGSKEAREEGKPICLVVYADWCPRCRELAPAFRTDEVQKLSGEVVMILQDSDEKPAWLKERYGSVGGYVPRVLFLKPDGTLRTDLTGGNARYPYYYWPGNPRLAANLKAVAASDSDQPAEASE